MEFSQFANILKRYSSTTNIANFVVELVDEIMEDDFNIRNPLSNLGQNMLEGIFSGRRQISKSNANAIKKNLDKARFELYIDKISPDARTELCHILKSYVGSDATFDNIASKCANLFADIITHIADKNTRYSDNLIHEFAVDQNIKENSLSYETISLLLAEVCLCCPLCGADLVRKIGMSAVANYAFVDIYPLYPTKEQSMQLGAIKVPDCDLSTIENKIALCRLCESEYLFTFSKSLYDKMQVQKHNAKLIFEAKSHIFGLNIENELTNIVHSLTSLTNEQLSNLLNYQPTKVESKIYPKYSLLKNQIRWDIVQYYNYINDLFAQQSSAKVNKLLKTVQYASDSFIDSGLEQTVVFECMTKWISNKTDTIDITACRIMTSYFVQNCEVFHEISQ
ncbi:MAG: hypothetical protein LBU60_06460 [Clostridiales bacterium]|jgi:hypothetical protein|nr:hypothetical protein [Clostridiales bacterium]